MPLWTSCTNQVLRQLNTCPCGENSTAFTNVILNNLRLPFAIASWMRDFKKCHGARTAPRLLTARPGRKCEITKDLNSSARTEDVNAVSSRLRCQDCSIMGINGVWDTKFTCSWECVAVCWRWYSTDFTVCQEKSDAWHLVRLVNVSYCLLVS